MRTEDQTDRALAEGLTLAGMQLCWYLSHEFSVAVEIRSVFVSLCRSLLVFGGASCPCGEPGRGLGKKISSVCGDSFYTLPLIDARGVHGNRTSYKARRNLEPFAKMIA